MIKVPVNADNRTEFNHIKNWTSKFLDLELLYDEVYDDFGHLLVMNDAARGYVKRFEDPRTGAV